MGYIDSVILLEALHEELKQKAEFDAALHNKELR
jgi:hypothetical protein